MLPYQSKTGIGLRFTLCQSTSPSVMTSLCSLLSYIICAGVFSELRVNRVGMVKLLRLTSYCNGHSRL